MRSLEARCAAESQDSPLRPVADMFAAMVEPLDAMLERRGFDLAETFPPLATALSLPPDDRWPRRPLPPEREKELAFDAFLRLLFAMAGERPVVFTFEDIHWADPTTLELIGRIVREIESSAWATRRRPAVSSCSRRRGPTSSPPGPRPRWCRSRSAVSGATRSRRWCRPDSPAAARFRRRCSSR